MRIHCIGIGGIGLSALAQFYHSQGDIISGSNLGETEGTNILKKNGINISFQHNEKLIDTDVDLVVYSEAIPEDNVERKKAKALNIPTKNYFEALGEISRKFTTIAVAGTHGKTTTVGIIASLFQEANFDATIFCGAGLVQFGGGNFHAGTNNFLVVEACEYRNNFQFLDPDIALVTNIDFDHPDSFESIKSYQKIFAKFLMKAKKIIHHESDNTTKKIIENFTGEKIPASEKNFAKILLKGEKNRLNANLTFQLSEVLGLEEERSLVGINNYLGATRRQEFLKEEKSADKNFSRKFYSDYAHHPSEITATIKFFREKFPTEKLTIIFQPHQFSRSRIFYQKIGEALREADEVFFLPIYEARDSEEDKKSISIEDFITAHGKSSQVLNTENFAKNFAKNFSQNEIVVWMGAGSIDDFARKNLLHQDYTPRVLQILPLT